jgi:hypothetical protein
VRLGNAAYDSDSQLEGLSGAEMRLDAGHRDVPAFGAPDGGVAKLWCAVPAALAPPPPAGATGLGGVVPEPSSGGLKPVAHCADTVRSPGLEARLGFEPGARPEGAPIAGTGEENRIVSSDHWGAVIELDS